jgi:hypothetical protein
LEPTSLSNLFRIPPGAPFLRANSSAISPFAHRDQRERIVTLNVSAAHTFGGNIEDLASKPATAARRGTHMDTAGDRSSTNRALI